MLSEVYDIECLTNCFTYTGFCRQDKVYYQFVIHSSQNDYLSLINHLFRDKLIMIGYNNDNYDYPIIHHLINHKEEYSCLSGLELSQKIYEKSQNIIDQQFSTVADWNKKIFQIDLFKIWHFDNLAKLTSLKSLEVSLNLPNIEDMPIHHTQWVKKEDISLILDYNKNDVIATNEFFNVSLGQTENKLYKGKNKIKLRQAIAKKYGLSGYNFNDIKLGTELILKLYCDKFNKNIQEVKKLRTPRKIVHLKDCIPIWCNFKTKEFNNLVNKFKTINIYNGITKGVLKYSVIYNGIKIDYGTGGAHASIKPGVYISDENNIIIDLDWDGMYPSLGITQNLFPEHLGKEFIDIYDGEIVSPRIKEKKKPKKERDFVIVEGFKLAANGSYGKTNEENSWLYDPLYAMKTTISGQILISMWTEMICLKIPEAKIIQINTDGITLIIPKNKEKDILSVSDKLSNISKLTYEVNYYNKMVIRDVNNYSSQYLNGEIKHKGCFEIDKELHKDPSMRIVPIALEQYFFHGIPIKETIENHKNIYDFCLRLRVDNRFISEYHYISDDYKSSIKELSKTTRYYISNKGGALYKKSFDSNKRIGVNIGFVTTLFNNYYESDNYDINYNFYIMECNKLINQIENKQLTLF